MALGYAIGPYFVGPNPERPKRLLHIGALVTLAFIVLRLTNLYGDPVKWVAIRYGRDAHQFLKCDKVPGVSAVLAHDTGARADAAWIVRAVHWLHSPKTGNDRSGTRSSSMLSIST